MAARHEGRMRRLWKAVRKRLPFARPEPPDEPRWPDEEPALVAVGPPRRPRPSAAAAVDPPSAPDALEYPVETDAVGPAYYDDDEDDAELNAASG